MAKETERKFLVKKALLPDVLDPFIIYREMMWQYYLVSSKECSVRLRKVGNSCTLTIKHNQSGISVDEIEFSVSFGSYLANFEDRVGREIVKTRYTIEHNGRNWELDVFHDELANLIVAELECDDAADVTDFPEWIGREVTHDYRYKNAVLATSDEWKDDYATDA
jgi:CYTH domain-containing protein